MAIGIVSDEDFEKELGRFNTPRPPEIVDIPSKGRDEGDLNVPESLRKIIGETAVIEGRASALDLAQSFGISASSVSAYAKGATSTTSYHNPSKELIKHIAKRKERVVKRATNKLNQALDALSQEKLDNVGARDLAGIAKDMSVIIKNMEPDTSSVSKENDVQAPQFVIFAPQFKKEEHYETINVSE